MIPAAIQDQTRRDRRAICALLAVFALLVQAVFAAPAFAGAAATGGQVICGAHGIIDPGHAPSPAGHSGGGCDHCVGPSAVGAPPTTLAIFGESVAYATLVDHEGPGASDCAPGRGLAAPPPPSRGPPAPMI